MDVGTQPKTAKAPKNNTHKKFAPECPAPVMAENRKLCTAGGKQLR